MDKELCLKVLKAICDLWKKYDGEACCIGRVTSETKLNEGQCRSIIEKLVKQGLITRVVTVDMNNHKRYCYKPVECMCEEVLPK